tara:strand:+ start:1269 stop:2576 length:1308 start_codon:yes stop_codon:yes gene_type:complete
MANFTDAQILAGFAGKEAQDNLKESMNLAKSFGDMLGDLIQKRKTESELTGKALDLEGQILTIGNQILTQKGDKLKIDNDMGKSALNALNLQMDIREQIAGQLSGVISFIETAGAIKDVLKTALINPLGLVTTLIGGAILAFLKFKGEVADARKELGLSVSASIKLVAANKALGLAAQGFGLELQDVESAQRAILSDLGGSVDEAIKLSLNFARTAAATGQSSEDLATTLSLMESLSSASRDVLLNQIRSNAAMIEAAGVAPALVMKDIAQNAEFFASFARDGGQNLIAASTAARKLGLDMSAVASITESLLDFETSIEKSMEASILLGRQINTDRARQLAIQGDQVGVMEEILKQVGGEAEFNRLNVLQRRALAESVGVNVEQLSRLVRNNQAAASGEIATAGGESNIEKLTSVSNQFLESADGKLGKLVRLME